MPREPTKRSDSPSPHGVHIPLPFDKAIKGLLAVKPKKIAKPKKKPAQK